MDFLPTFLLPAILLLPSLLLAQSEPQFKAETLRYSSVEILRDGHLGGTGFFTDTNGTVVTAAHVLAGPDHDFAIRMLDGTRVEMVIEVVDEGHDIARLGFKESERAQNKKIRPLTLARRAPAEGRMAHMMGTPIFRHHVLFTGHLARTTPTYEYAGGHFTTCIFAASAAPKGCSGGPWVNRKGEVFAVQCAYVSIGGTPQGLCMLAPPKALRELLVRKGHASTPTMDAAVEELFTQTPEFIKGVGDYKGPALVARQVKKKGPAGKAGLKEFDLITAIDGKGHDTVNAFMDALRAKKPQDTVTLSVRDKTGINPREIEITLGRLEQAWVR